MNGGVERGVGGLEAQEIAVGAGFAPEAQFIWQPFAEAEGDGERGFFFNGANDLSEPRGLDAEVFAGLQDDRAEAEVDCLVRAGENLFARHAIAGHGAGGAQAAVVALADAVAGDLDEAAQVDVVADVGAAGLRRRGRRAAPGRRGLLRAASRDSSWAIRGHREFHAWSRIVRASDAPA